MKKMGRLAIVAVALFGVHSLAGCALLDRDSDLPKERSVQVVVFPVRSLQYENLICMQDGGNVKLTGRIRNISYSTIPNIRLRAEILYYDQVSTQKMTSPFPIGTLLPGEANQFSLSATVDRPVKHVELHASWDTSF